MVAVLDLKKKDSVSKRQQSKPDWHIIDRQPDSATVTVELRIGDVTQRIDLKGVPVASAYFTRGAAVKGRR